MSVTGDDHMFWADVDQKTVNLHFASIVIRQSLEQARLSLIELIEVLEVDARFSVVAGKPGRLDFFVVSFREHLSNSSRFANSCLSVDPPVVELIQIWMLECA